MDKSKMDELQEQQEQVVTTFLDELPQAPLPPQFMERVMQQITAAPTTLYPEWTPGRFRLTALDVLLPAFATIFTVLMYWLTQQDFTQLSMVITLPAYIAEFEPLTFDVSWLYIGIVLAVGELLLLLGMAWFWMEDQPILSFEL